MKKLFVYAFAAMLAFTGVAVFAGGDRAFSENENRKLTVASDVVSADVLSGDFQKELTEYSSDQFPGRDFLTRLATEIKKKTGRKDIGGAYIGKDGFYFEKKLDKDIDLERFERNLKKVEKIALKYPEKKVTVMLVPESGSVYRNKLPDNAEIFNDDLMYEKADELLPSCRVINLKEQLKKESGKDGGDNLYYRTDHHWTLAGAYEGYRALMGKKCTFAVEEVSDDFLGTLYSKVLDRSAEKTVAQGGSRDIVSIPVIEDKIKVVADGKEMDLFDRSALNEKDKYKVYFGGNYGITVVGAEGSQAEGRKLTVIKDSFANSLVPLLMEDYEEIIMADMRYTSANIDMIAGDSDEILFLYQLSNFAGDTSIAKLTI